jgi:chaperonin GroEL
MTPITKQIINRSDLRPVIKEAMVEIAAIVKRTLGPGGNAILLQREPGQMGLDGTPLSPKITKDGVSVAEECASPDPVKDLVIQTIKGICKKTNNIAGDGTTTAIVLGEAILLEAFAELEKYPELNPQLVKEELEAEVKKIIVKLKKMSIKVKNPKVIRQVATISANGDSEIGDIIGDAFDHVGAEGVVTVDEGHTNKVTLEIVDGYQFQRGAEGRDKFFNVNNTHFEAQNAEVIIFDDKLLNYTSLMAPLNAIARTDQNGRPGRPLPPIVIIANEFSNEVIQFLIMQKIEMGLQFCAVRGPHQTTVRSGYYEDLAILLGGSKLGNGGKSLSAFEPDDAGIASKIIVDKYKTTIYGGAGADVEILNRVEILKGMKTQAESPYDAQVINDRIAALTSGIAKIGVGGSTDLEIKEKYDRIEDALNAARASIEEGVVAGGGVTLFRLAHEIKAENAGSRILQRALKAPIKQILENIGQELTPELEAQLLADSKTTYDARNKRLVDAFKAGILDPVKVTRSGLENALSIAALLSTAGGAIIFKKRD